MRQENNANNITCREAIVSEDYVDIYHRLKSDDQEGIDLALRETGAFCAQRMVNDWVILYIKKTEEECIEYYFDNAFYLVPNLYGLSGMVQGTAPGIPPAQSSQLNFSGTNTLVAVVDTGINYTHESFIYEDNTSKIYSIWDQTIQDGTPPKGFAYGTEYTNEEINKAIASDDPYSIVPTKDDLDHGTFLAGVAAGREKSSERFVGVARDAELIIVKMKQAKKCNKSFFKVADDVPAYQTGDIYKGIQYVIKKAHELQRPLAIVFTMATSFGPHNGGNEIEQFLAREADLYGVALITSAGNEANARHHFHGVYNEKQKTLDCQINLNEKDGIFINMWVPLPDQLSIAVMSPSGETTDKIPIKSKVWQSFSFRLAETSIQVQYDLTEQRSSEESINIIISNPTPGLWTITTYADSVANGNFDLYLPVRSFIGDNTFLLSPNPYTTVTIPATNEGTLTVGAYNSILNSLYLPSGRGFTRSNAVKPDIVAPGVNIKGPVGEKDSYQIRSGTSIASAVVTGSSALLLEWGVVDGNDPTINTRSTKTYLARGALHREGLRYPNKEWGYGQLDLNNTFRNISVQ